MLFHKQNYNAVMFFNREIYKIAIIFLKDNLELKATYILSLGCFKNGFIESRDLDNIEIEICNNLMLCSKNKFEDYRLESDKLKNILDCKYLYTEDDVILPDVLNSINLGNQVIAKNSLIEVVSSKPNVMSQDRWRYAVEKI